VPAVAVGTSVTMAGQRVWQRTGSGGRILGRAGAQPLSPRYSTPQDFGSSVSKVTGQKWQKECSVSAPPSLLRGGPASTGKAEGDSEGFGYGFF